jgi:glycosyltransferase involved in cell wall biosynthesis
MSQQTSHNDWRTFRLLIVQWMGDYREAYERLAAGGPETYYAQRHTVMDVGELGRELQQAGVLCCCSSSRYDAVVANGVRSMGAAINPQSPDMTLAISLAAQFQPTHLVLTAPSIPLLRWGLAQGIHILPQFADSFVIRTAGLAPWRKLARLARQGLYHRRLASLLNDSRVRWVSNHNINACRDLVRIGVSPNKVVPYDWPPAVRPDMHEPKSLAVDSRPWRLAFVGSVVPSKGVGDAIDAVAELRARGRPVELRVIGRGSTEGFAQQAKAKGVEELVRFEGLQPQSRVMEEMRSADVMLVPSWHEYPEGLPLTIYESLASRTPLVCSDHPMFRGRVGEGRSTLCVPEKQPTALADAIERIMTDADLYARMSRASADVWEQLQCPVKYGDMIRRWLSGTPEDNRYLAEHSLASGRYDQR